MSLFDGDLNIDGIEPFREMLEKLAVEVSQDRDLLKRVSDHVFSELGREAIDEAREVGLKPQTQRSKDTFFGRAKKERKRKRRRGKGRFTGKSPGVAPFEQSPNADGLYSALTLDFDDAKGNRAAERTIVGKTLTWGTKGKINYAHPHIEGSSRGLPARLALLQPRRFALEAEDRVKDVMADWLGSKLEKAGAPVEFIQAVTEGRW